MNTLRHQPIQMVGFFSFLLCLFAVVLDTEESNASSNVFTAELRKLGDEIDELETRALCLLEIPSDMLLDLPGNREQLGLMLNRMKMQVEDCFSRVKAIVSPQTSSHDPTSNVSSDNSSTLSQATHLTPVLNKVCSLFLTA